MKLNKKRIAGKLDIFNIPANYFISTGKRYFYFDGEDYIELDFNSFEDKMVVLQYVREGGEVFYSFKTDKEKLIERAEALENKIVEFMSV